jgi:signal transduction histidine kinase
VAICLLLLAGLTYHEFVREPRRLQELGIKEPPGSEFGEIAEVLLYAAVPVVFIFGWWLVRKSLTPLDELAHGVERFHAENLRERLPRTHNRDEVDRLTASFNAMAARLEQSFQQVREFTLHASHELKTPLTVMRAQLETALADGEKSPQEQREWMHAQLDEVQRLAKLVDGLTLLTKADSGLLTLEQKSVALDELVAECFDDTLIMAHSQQIQVIMPTCEKAMVRGDRHRLRQLMLNLADNAVKYNHRGGRVVMELRTRAGIAEFEITNTGAGIAEDLQPHIFDRFIRGNEARSMAVEGCGLGLTICQWIVREHGGTIEVHSGLGQTTTFKVGLLLTQQPELVSC